MMKDNGSNRFKMIVLSGRQALFFLLALFYVSLSAPYLLLADQVHEGGSAVQPSSQQVLLKDARQGVDADLLAELGEDFGSDEEAVQVADPLQSYNRLVFKLNDWLYVYFFRPGAIFYEHLFPASWRRGIGNFFYNLRTPLRLGNDFLQARFIAGGKEIGRFCVNTLCGFGGLLDPARGISLLRPLPAEQDLGLTLANWGIGHGCYLVWPVMGPSSLRDSVGMIGDRFMDPVSYVKPVPLSLGLVVEDKLNSFSFSYQDYDTLKKGAIDPYLAFRNAYFQYRRSRVRR